MQVAKLKGFRRNDDPDDWPDLWSMMHRETATGTPGLNVEPNRLYLKNGWRASIVTQAGNKTSEQEHSCMGTMKDPAGTVASTPKAKEDRISVLIQNEKTASDVEMTE